LKTQILANAVIVYEEPDASSPVVATLESGVLLDSDEPENNGQSNWINVILPDGTRKYLISDIVPHVDKAWAEVYNSDRTRLGFLQTETIYRAEQNNELTAIFRTDKSLATVRSTLAEVLRQEKWTIKYQSKQEICVNTVPNPFNQTNIFNVLLGLLRFCFWPLIYRFNHNAKIFPANFIPNLNATILLHPKGAGSVVRFNAMQITFLDFPFTHCYTTHLLKRINTDFQAIQQTSNTLPASNEEEGNMSPKIMAAPLIAAKPLIRFTCPSCNKKLKAPADAEGRSTHCPRCGIALAVPRL